MGSTNGQLCQKVEGSALPQVGKAVADHGVRQRRYLVLGQTNIEVEAKQLTWSSGILNAAGTSGDVGAVKAMVSFESFFDSLEICVSQGIVTARTLDCALTLYCTKAAGMFFLSKRILTQHSPTCSKVFLTSTASSVPVRVRSRLVGRSAKAIVRMYSPLTLQQRCMPKERRLLARSLQSPRHH